MNLKFRKPGPTGIVAIAAGVAALAFAGCGGDDSSEEATATSAATAPAAATGTATSLKGVCPATVVVQTDWNPESEHSELYQMAGKDGTTDTSKKTYTAPLLDNGADTGVKIQIRVGGPAIGFQTVSSQMYQDKSIMLGYVNTDEAIQLSKKQPTTAVVAPREETPFMLMFDPGSYQFKSIADVGKSDAKVLYFQGATYMDWLIGKGLIKKSQTDSSYDGTPARFVTSGGKVVQQGFVTAEPWMYENTIKQWGKPVTALPVSEAGYSMYAETIASRTADLSKNAACLKKLVPVIQRAQVAYTEDPAAANALIVKLVEDYKTGWVYPAGLADYSAKTQVEKGIISNGPDSTLGNFDDAKTEKLIAEISPIFAKNGKPIKDGLTAADVQTNDYIDPAIGLDGATPEPTTTTG